MTQDAKVKSTTSISRIWIIPILVVLIGGWMVYYQWKNQGPLITLEVQSATGIEVNKTPIKVKDLEIGQVKKITLKPDLEGVLVTARMPHICSLKILNFGLLPLVLAFQKCLGSIRFYQAVILRCRPMIQAKKNCTLLH